MSSAIRTFFEQFTDLSSRAAKHWPLPDQAKESKIDPGVDYNFEVIITKQKLVSEVNKPLIKSFFTKLYRKKSCLFSGSPMFTAKQVQDQISSLEDLKKTSLKHDSFRVCTFLIIGHVPVSGKTTKVARTGCVGFYFPNSQTILLESIWMADDLQVERELDRRESISTANVLPEDEREMAELLQFSEEEQKTKQEREEQETKRGKAKDQQTVLTWMLTYQNPQARPEKRDAALFKLIKVFNEASLEVKGIFHEALNPVTLSDDESMQNAAKRLETFHAIEARYLKFAYQRPVGPAHSTNSNGVKNKRLRSEKQSTEYKSSRSYYLLIFPQFLELAEELTIQSSIAMKFIIDYGKFLHPIYENYQVDLAECVGGDENKGEGFKPGKQPDIKGFQKGDSNDPIVCNNLSLFDNRLSKKHLTHLYLHHIPRLEQPRFIYRRASISFEIVIDEDYFEPVRLHSYHNMTPSAPEPTWLGRIWTVIRNEWSQPQHKDPIPLYCPVAHSGETDLFSYKYQAEPPYFTRYYTVKSDVYVSFPSYFEFTSEGRVENFYRLPKPEQRNKIDISIKPNEVLPGFMYTVRMNACVSYTYFRKSSVRVWHLVLKSGADDISELEIIKLMRFFSGSQEHEGEDERREVMRQIQFSLTNPLSISADETHQQLPNETDQQFPNWKFLSKLADWFYWSPVKFSHLKLISGLKLTEWFYWPPFEPNPEYETDHEKIVQKWAWGLKTGGRCVFWTLAGLLIIGVWRWWLPGKVDTIWHWHPLQTPYDWRTILYWFLGLLLLTKLWNWLFRGIGRGFRDSYLFFKRKVRRIFIKKELPNEMEWLHTPDNLIQLLQDLTGVYYKQKNGRQLDKMDKADQAVSLRNVSSGVVEIDTGGITPVPENLIKEEEETFDDANFLDFYKNPDFPKLGPEKRNEIRNKVRELYKDLHDNNIQMEDDPEPFTVEEYADYIFKSYCGICLGIFDYDRMGFQEIDDTLVPLPDSKTEESFLVIHRGVLAMLGYDDDVMNTFWDTLGINAYLLIPSAVLALNDKVARDAERRLNIHLHDLRFGISKLSIRELNEERNYIDDLLNDDILGNVFQYKTEQELYRQGMERRGIDERIKDSRSKLEQLDKLINIKQEESTTRYQQRITYLATIVGIFSFYTVVHDYFVKELSTKKETGNIPWNEIPFWFKIPVSFIDELVPISLLPVKDYDALDLAHIAITCVFTGLFLYIVVSIWVNPNRNRKFFWQRNRSRSRTLLKYHGS